MNRLTGEQLFSLMGDMDPRLVAEALPPSLRAGGQAAPKPRRTRRMAAFWDSGWTAVILSAVVSIAVLAAVVAAGRLGSDTPAPPVGAIPSTEQESFPETASPYDPPVGTTPYNPPVGTTPSTEQDSLPETAPPYTPPVVDPVINKITVAIDLPDGTSTYVSGNPISATELWDDGSLVSASIESATFEESVAKGVPIVKLPQGTLPYLRHEVTEGWTYTVNIGIYSSSLIPQEQFDGSSTRYNTTGRGDMPVLSEVPVGNYYLKINLWGKGPYLPEVDGHESYSIFFVLRLEVTEASALSIETTTHTPGHDNLVILKSPPSDTAPLAFSYEVTLAGSVRRGAELSVRIRFENVSDETVGHGGIPSQSYMPHVHIYRLDSQSEKQTILFMSASEAVDMKASILLAPGDTDEQASGGQGFVYEGYTIPADAAFGTYHMDIIADWGDTPYTATFYNVFSLRDPNGESAPEKSTSKVASMSPVHIMSYSAGGAPHLVTNLTAAEPGAELTFSTAFALYRVENGEETLIGQESLDDCIMAPAPEDPRAYAIARASVSLKAMCYLTGTTCLDPGTYRLYYTGYGHQDISVDFTVTETVQWD